MKLQLQTLIIKAIETLKADKDIPFPDKYEVLVERTRDSNHGDFSTNIAMVMAKKVGLKPRELAQKIIDHISITDFVDKTEIAGPGFINFFIKTEANQQIIKDILSEGEQFGVSNHGNGDTVLVEFVSANPTGPLHIGHGRGAAYGAAVSNLLETIGFKVTREYYVNDAGRQMDILAISVWLRYLRLCGQEIPFPKKAYQADYVNQIAKKIFDKEKNSLEISVDELFTKRWSQLDNESQLDEIIEYTKRNLKEKKYRLIFKAGLDEIVDDIRDDLQELGVVFDNWFSEQSLTSNELVDKCIEELRNSDVVYEKSGALWFRSSQYGDEKDRVIVRDNGQKTYFASDIAYHRNKFERGFSKIIDIWGADHHGYIDRVKAALIALGKNSDALDILLVQFASLFRGGEKVQMSTRSGNYVTLRELRQEVGNDATRFFYVTRKSEQHLDFDLDLAKSQSNDNPVYYIQYAHARICSVISQMKENGYDYDQEQSFKQLGLLVEPHEQALLSSLSRYSEVILNAAVNYEPHHVGFYLRELANDFHSYYNSHQFLIDNAELRFARISLVYSVKQVISNGLTILGVSVPEKM